MRLSNRLLAVCLGLSAGLASVVNVASVARAQTDLGGQRVATSSGTFLKIGLDARAAGLAGAYNAIARGPSAVFYNPAGLLEDDHSTSLALQFIQWPGDIQIGAFSASRDLPTLGARVAAGVAFFGTDFPETSEFYPLGTGRTVSYSDLLVAVSFARNFTDRLAIGVTAKYLREDMASNVGGPLAHGMLLDAGTVYRLGYRNARLAITLAHFGPDLEPTGSFESRVTGSTISYSAFSPPTQFQLGFSIDAMNRDPHRISLATQVLHQADNQETLRGGLEYLFRERIAVRTGYDFSADEMAFAAGLGFRTELGGRAGSLDYAYTEGGRLPTVHRWSLGFAL